MFTLIYDGLAVLTVLSAVTVMSVNSPVVSVLFLIAAFGFSACYLLTIGVGFIGVSYLIVYVGAIAVLFLFVVMMLNVRINEIVTVGREYSAGLPLAILISILFALEMLSVLPVITLPWDTVTYVFNLVNGSILGLNSFGSIAAASDAVSSFGLISTPETLIADTNQVQSLGLAFYGYQSPLLLIISIVLLLAMIGAIVLCLRSRVRV